jgi:glutaredoxin-related protein
LASPVFINGVSVGGGDDTTALRRQGKLKTLLEEAGALQ